MASPFLGLNIGGNALNAFQSSVDTIANNMANVNTKGYTRQETQLESTLAIRVYSRYGSVGTGVQATSVEQIRNQFYDDKFWANNANTGYYDKELYYLEQIQEVMKDDSTQTGFATLFSRLFNNLETLKTNAADPSVRNQFIHQAQNFCTYFNMISNSLSTIQEDCNEEIKNTVEEINEMLKEAKKETASNDGCFCFIDAGKEYENSTGYSYERLIQRLQIRKGGSPLDGS